ncbi:histone-lysine N-methyltransferase SETMAR-like [Octopus bimaculoides]|uniref:histone-lysine N-methyltransferase SETMAR-like n=1 Tax=Octopus bimaculoides TaxID=37653 RepID=UPI0022E3AE19|nr:histone-lysine N-methyltransferase SETMAR-like [Octopus bimaculoides]
MTWFQVQSHCMAPQIMKMECQVKKNKHFQHLLLFAFNQGSKATKAARDICAVYEEGAIAERTTRDWYAKFKNGNFYLKDAPHSGCPVEFDEERLNQLLHENSHQTTRELAEKIECSHTAIEKHFHSMGKVQKYGAWVPHAFSDNKNQ